MADQKVDHFYHRCPMCSRIWGHTGCFEDSEVLDHCWNCVDWSVRIIRSTASYVAFMDDPEKLLHPILDREDDFTRWAREARKKTLTKSKTAGKLASANKQKGKGAT